MSDLLGKASLGIFRLRLRIEPHQQLNGRAELLDPDVAKAKRFERLADRLGWGRCRRAQLRDNPTAKIDAEIEPGIKKQNDRKRAQYRGRNHPGEPAAHELNVRIVGD